MHKLGTLLIWLGAILTLVGLVLGFGFLFADSDDLAEYLLALVPVGFMLLFTGIVATLFGAPEPKR